MLGGVKFKSMSFDNLPKVNERKAKSNEMQLELEIKLRKTIKEFEKENDYELRSYERDNVLLNLIKKNHESYLRSDFGNDMID